MIKFPTQLKPSYNTENTIHTLEFEITEIKRLLIMKIWCEQEYIYEKTQDNHT